MSLSAPHIFASGFGISGLEGCCLHVISRESPPKLRGFPLRTSRKFRLPLIFWVLFRVATPLQDLLIVLFTSEIMSTRHVSLVRTGYRC